MTFFIITVSDVSAANEDFERVIMVFIVEAFLLHLLDFLGPLFAMAAETEFLFVAPEHFGFSLIPLFRS